MEDDLEEAKQASIKKRRRLAGAAKASQTKKKKITDLQDKIIELETALSKFKYPENPATVGSSEKDKRPELKATDIMQALAILMEASDLRFDVYSNYGRCSLQLRTTNSIVDLPANVTYETIKKLVQDLS